MHDMCAHRWAANSSHFKPIVVKIESLWFEAAVTSAQLRQHHASMHRLRKILWMHHTSRQASKPLNYNCRPTCPTCMRKAAVKFVNWLKYGLVISCILILVDSLHTRMLVHWQDKDMKLALRLRAGGALAMWCRDALWASCKSFEADWIDTGS